MKENEEINEFEEVQTVQETQEFQEVESKKKKVKTGSYFDGGLLELIGWRLLAFLISAITLGIATPWAMCMLYAYQINHTVYNGKRLRFEGTGGDLFVNIFKWVFFTIITLGIYLFFVPVRKAKWVISNIHYEDEDFIKGDSYFDGSTLQFIGINILSKILVVLSLGLLYPFAYCMRLRWINKHTIINRKKLVFAGKALSLWGNYLLWLFLSIITLGIFALWLPILYLKWQSKNIHIKTVNEGEQPLDKSFLIIIPIIILLIIIIASICTKASKWTDDDWNNFITKYHVEDVLKVLDAKDTVEINDNRRDLEEKIEILKREELLNLKTESSSAVTPAIPATPSVPSTPSETDTLKVGSYTVAYGTYTGKDALFDWELQKEIPINIKLVLNKNNLQIDGQTLSYSVQGIDIVANGMPMFRVLGNNKIQYLAQSCPELVYQGI